MTQFTSGRRCVFKTLAVKTTLLWKRAFTNKLILQIIQIIQTGMSKKLKCGNSTVCCVGLNISTFVTPRVSNNSRQKVSRNLIILCTRWTIYWERRISLALFFCAFHSDTNYNPHSSTKLIQVPKIWTYGILVYQWGPACQQCDKEKAFSFLANS